jgi:small redox-active disulfide protein 2
MRIEVLGMGCPKCKKLMELAQAAAKELNIEAEFVKVTAIKDIMNYGVMVTPALAVDGNVKSAGKIPSVDEIKKWMVEKNVFATDMDPRNKKNCGPCSCGNC